MSLKKTRKESLVRSQNRARNMADLRIWQISDKLYEVKKFFEKQIFNIWSLILNLQ